MEFSSIILWSVFYLTCTGNSSRMRGFLLQLVQVRFPNRRSIFICIEQGQGHCKGARRRPPIHALLPGGPEITASARRTHTSHRARCLRGVAAEPAPGEAAGRDAGSRCGRGGLAAAQWQAGRRRRAGGGGGGGGGVGERSSLAEPPAGRAHSASRGLADAILR